MNLFLESGYDSTHQENRLIKRTMAKQYHITKVPLLLLLMTLPAVAVASDSAMQVSSMATYTNKDLSADQEVSVDALDEDQSETVQAKPRRQQLRDPTITYNMKDGATYTGQWNYYNEPHGRGHYVAKDGSEYQGTFENGLFHGEGVYFYVNGDIYRGQWRKGKRHGQGSMNYKNGNLYEGRWANGMRHGKGVLQYRSGSRYEGDWKLGKRHGRGMYVSKSGQRYLGDYAFNKPHGRGAQVESNGDSYTGTFSKGKKHGVGECAPRNGDLTICLFDRGRRILNPKLLERAAAYHEKNQPTYEFDGGIGFLFEDHYTKQRRWLTSEAVYWDTIEAMLATQLRIRSENPGQVVSFVIDDYRGPGTYQLPQGKFLAAIGSSKAIGLRDGERMTLEITSDSKGVIEGTFNASRLVSKNGKNSRAFTIRNGQFEASKYVEPEPELEDNSQMLKDKYRPDRNR